MPRHPALISFSELNILVTGFVIFLTDWLESGLIKLNLALFNTWFPILSVERNYGNWLQFHNSIWIFFNQGNIFWSSRRLKDVFQTSWRLLLYYVLSVKIFHPPRRLKNVLQRHLEDVLKKPWKIKNCYTEDIFEDVLKACLEEVLKSSR